MIGLLSRESHQIRSTIGRPERGGEQAMSWEMSVFEADTSVLPCWPSQTRFLQRA